MEPIRVALAGAGNCAWSFSQFTALAQANPEARLPGLMSHTVGGYRLADVTIVAAFDVDAAKVGLPLAEVDGLGAVRVGLRPVHPQHAGQGGKDRHRLLGL
ncbi:hypothetical protein AB0D15_14540, partial [Streptomyces sp. NPDC048551]